MRFFQIVLKQAEAKPEDVIMVGDRVDNDIFPAKLLGMGTIHFHVGPHKVQPILSPEYEADVRVKNVKELLYHLENWGCKE